MSLRLNLEQLRKMLLQGVGYQMRSFIIIFSTLLSFLSLTAAAEVSGPNFDEFDEKIIQAFDKRCDRVTFLPLAFPALTYSKDDLVSCEISKAFDP